MVLDGVFTDANCEDTNITYTDLGAGYLRYMATIVGKKTGSTFQQELPGVGGTQFNASVMPFNNETDPRRQSFVYVIFTPLTMDETQNAVIGPANISATICSPIIGVQSAIVEMDTVSRTVFSAAPLTTDKDSDGPLKPLDILNGTSAAFNGYFFDVSAYGPIVGDRKEATMFGLVSAMYQAALALPGGLSQAYQENLHYSLASNIYQNYLGIMARSTYFNDTQPIDNALSGNSVTTQNLLFISSI
ncbi:hypothetical protein BV25DRAFT_727561 [Artomyces pyxidatus]|uniref:Uncharacterized protein n=1 Tax=Artomyces pyxidatus TaxID=48021 RepID=A0ACB8T0D0_9AGAM|nr:hypothetical protein BV25DRAFT_727561 [Artomyces pyxidatus]